MDDNYNFQLLKYQFTHGCDRLNCSSEFCPNNPSSFIRQLSQQEIVSLAKNLSVDFSEEYVCKNLPLKITSKKCFHTVASFEMWSRSDYYKKVHIIQASEYIKSVFNIPEFVGYLMLDEQEILSSKNPSLPSEYVLNFIKKIAGEKELDELICTVLIKNIEYLRQPNVLDRYSSIRALLVLLLFPQVLCDYKGQPIAMKILMIIKDFDLQKQKIFVEWMSQLPLLLKEFVSICHACIHKVFMSSSRPRSHCIEILDILQPMKLLSMANRRCLKPVLASVFYNQSINSSIDLLMELEFPKNGCKFTYLSYPFILSLKNKARLGRCESKVNLKRYTTDRRNKNFVLSINRNNIISDSISQILSQNSSQFLKRLYVIFEGEKAYDAGGPSREFLHELSQRLFSPEYGMFTDVNGTYKWFTPVSFEGDDHFFLVGTVIGLALRNDIMLPVRFPKCLYKKLIQPEEKLNIRDLSDIEPDTAENLLMLLEMKKTGQDISELCLTFDISVSVFGSQKTIPLVSGMSNVDVTNSNVDLYIDSLIEYKLTTQIERQFSAFKRGFEFSCKTRSYYLFEPEELDIILSGEQTYDWDALKTSTKLKNTTPISRAIRNFWKVMDALDLDQKKKLLKFITGSDCPPVDGLKGVHMTIQVTKSSHSLPTARTCSKTLLLPDYSTYEEMLQKIVYSISETEGFGFI